ncbi:MAG: mlaA [Proteobacteria bacterium]|nr:mlaA [Pseudomonadota bacterium]
MKICKLAGLFFASLLVLGGCASTASNPVDPWESVNRKIFVFNDKVDTYALKPVAQGYSAAVPLPARTNVANFFGNVEDLWIGFNNLLQGKPRDGLSDFGRFALNSSIGILGFFDIASEVGLEKHDEDFGQTLGRWGVGDGPYVVLPLLGPSTVRDTGGMIVDRLVYNPSSMLESVPARNGLFATKVVSLRAQLLGAETTLDEAALDKYVFMRTFQLQRRRSLIYDGRPPREKDEDFSLAPRVEPLGLGMVNQSGLFDLVLADTSALPPIDSE